LLSFQEFYKPGIVYGLDSRLWFDNGFGFGSDLGYFYKTRTYAGDEFSLTAYSWEGSLLYSLKGNAWLRPYFGAGVSVDYSSERLVGGSETANNFNVGYQADAGVEFKLQVAAAIIQK
jgi:opacity protein-like surface antigen